MKVAKPSTFIYQPEWRMVEALKSPCNLWRWGMALGPLQKTSCYYCFRSAARPQGHAHLGKWHGNILTSWFECQDLGFATPKVRSFMILQRLFTSRPGELRPKARERGREKALRVCLGSHDNQIQQMSSLVAALFGTSLSLILLRCWRFFAVSYVAILTRVERFGPCVCTVSSRPIPDEKAGWQWNVTNGTKARQRLPVGCAVLEMSIMYSTKPGWRKDVDEVQDNSMMAYWMWEHFLHSPILSRSYMRLWAEDLGVAATCPNVEVLGRFDEVGVERNRLRS